MEEINESIVKKIKGLLAIANDNKNDEESQSAFLLAQKLMLKHKISIAAIEENSDRPTIEEGQVTAHKKLFWWERKLAIVISENFRVKNYVNTTKLSNERQRKSALVFFGYEKDVELAKEMYILAYDALKFYSSRFVDEYYQHRRKRTLKTTLRVKDSYIGGFLEGMDTKFKEQVEQMQQEYGLMLLVPKEVEDTFAEMSKDFGKGADWRIPPIEELVAYQEGFFDAKGVDYTKSTIDDEIFS